MKTILRRQELSCPSCIAKIDKALKAEDVVQDAKVHFNTGRIEIEHDPAKVDDSRLIQVVQSVGYTSHVSPY